MENLSMAFDLVTELRNANARGVHPPQNWTHRAIEEIEGWKNKYLDMLEQRNKLLRTADSADGGT